MSLLTYDWHPPDPTGAVNAYLSGVRLGQQQQQQYAQEAQFAAKQAQEQIEESRRNEQRKQSMALQLAHETRLEDAEKLRQKYLSDKAARDADLASPFTYNRGGGGSYSEAPLPEDAAPAEPSGPAPLPVGTDLLASANAADAATQADTLSLAQPSPFVAGSATPSLNDPGTFSLASANPLGGGDWTNGDAASGLVGDADDALPLPGGPSSDSSLYPSGEIVPPGSSSRRPVGRVTSYGYNGDTFGGPGAKASRIGPSGNALDDASMAVSPDIEKMIRAKGYKLGDHVTMVLANGEQITRRFDDRTAQWDPTGRWSVADGGQFIDKVTGAHSATMDESRRLPALTGRFDFHASGGKAAPFTDASIAEIVPEDGSSGRSERAIAPARNAPIADMAEQLAALGIPKGLAYQRLATAAAHLATTSTTAKAPTFRTLPSGDLGRYNADTGGFDVVAKKPDGAGQTRDQYIQQNYPEGVTSTERGTYKLKDGTEIFLGRSATGKFTERPFNPTAHPARLIDGTDGRKYAVDSQGEPMEPMPDGVSLGKMIQPHYTNVAGVGAVMIDSAGQGHVIVPSEVQAPAKTKEEYMDAVLAVSTAKDKLETQQELLKSKPGFFGGSQSKVDAAQKELDTASKKAAEYISTYPQLKPAGMPAASPAGARPATPEPSGDPLAAARAAIAAGKDPVAVRKRLQDHGINPAGL